MAKGGHKLCLIESVDSAFALFSDGVMPVNIVLFHTPDVELRGSLLKR